MNYNEIISTGKEVIASKIDGIFNGFNREKLFPLSNGQFWIQAEYKYWYYYHFMANVKIYKYKECHYLTIENQEEFVEVKLIKDVFKATIISDFNGWSGNTIFELDNNQIWKQNEYDYDYNYSYRPNAVIYSTGFHYRILVEGKSIGVERIK